MHWLRRASQAVHSMRVRGAEFQRAAGANVVTVFAVGSIALVGVVGMAVDYSRLSLARAELQERLDRALIAGVLKDGPDRIVAAETVFDTTITGSTAKPLSRSFRTEDDGLSGTATAAVSTTLASVVGIRSLDVSARSLARRPAAGEDCVLVHMPPDDPVPFGEPEQDDPPRDCTGAAHP